MVDLDSMKHLKVRVICSLAVPHRLHPPCTHRPPALSVGSSPSPLPCAALRHRARASTPTPTCARRPPIFLNNLHRPTGGQLRSGRLEAAAQVLVRRLRGGILCQVPRLERPLSRGRHQMELFYPPGAVLVMCMGVGGSEGGRERLCNAASRSLHLAAAFLRGTRG